MMSVTRAKYKRAADPKGRNVLSDAPHPQPFRYHFSPQPSRTKWGTCLPVVLRLTSPRQRRTFRASYRSCRSGVGAVEGKIGNTASSDLETQDKPDKRRAAG